MAIEAYDLCPGGTGKKVKHCGCRDFLPQLNQVIKAIDGEQNAGALQQLDQLLAAHGERACVLALKSAVQFRVNNVDGAKETVKAFLKVSPDNATALAQAATVAAMDQDADLAVERLQDALERLGESMPLDVYRAIGLVGRALLQSGSYLAARGHFVLMAVHGGEVDTSGQETLLQLNSMTNVPLLLKQDLLLQQDTKDEAAREPLSEAMKAADRGAWRKTCRNLEQLAEKFPEEPAIWANLAIFRAWLNDRQGAGEAWQEYASLDSVGLADRVDAEAFRQLLCSRELAEKIPQVMITHTVTDIERLMESLLSDRRVASMGIDPSTLAAEGEPPPKGLFWLLDRPTPASSESLAREEIPNVIGELLVYGKQTDREAR